MTDLTNLTLIEYTIIDDEYIVSINDKVSCMSKHNFGYLLHIPDVFEYKTDNEISHKIICQLLSKDGIDVKLDGRLIKYKGQMVENKPHGRGLMLLDKVIYTGDWIDGKLNNPVLIDYINGDKYNGDINSNCKNGVGESKYSNGNFYKGDWKHDKQHGNGLMNYSNGDVYEGEWIENNKHGQGVMCYKNGDVYEGEWKFNQKQGKGTMVYTNGDVFKGEWYENLRTRFGTMAYVNGDTYTGGWGSDGRFANGVLIYANGDKYDGYFHHDKKDGKGILTLAKPDDKGNICYVGNWKEDVMVGEFSCFNGNPVKMTY